MADVVVTVRDVDEVRQVLAACQNYFAALDLAERQRHLSTQTAHSAIYGEVARMRERFDSYMGDYLMQKHEAEIENEDEEEVEEEESEEELSGTPFGSFDVPKQAGRKVPVEELREREQAE